MSISHIALGFALAFAAFPFSPALAADDAAAADATADANRDILVIAPTQTATIENTPAPPVTITADRIATTVNAINVDDALKYFPSLVVRKRHIGDTQAVLATRTSGLGASARSLIFADGALISTLIGNNNGNASPRWGLVAPDEVERIDVLYGPFSAAYAGNSIGAVVNITTRLPEHLEASVMAQTQVQRFSQYDTQATYPSYQFTAAIGDRFGPLTLQFNATRTDSRGQPLTYVTATRPTATSTAGTPTSGGFDDLNRTAAPIRVLGAGGIEHNVQDIFKAKAALDIGSAVRLTYVGALFRDDTDSTTQTYLTTGATGAPAYAGTFNIDGRAYAVAASAFSAGVYHRRSEHWSHSLSLAGDTDRLDWQVIGTMYDYGRDVQRTPTVALPGGFTSGAGNLVDLNGTGWRTLDARAAWRSADANHIISIGGHYDRYRINSNRSTVSDWIGGAAGALNLASRGTTRTLAVWGQDEIRLLDTLTLTLGGRYEWWRAQDGFNFSASPALSALQPIRTAEGFSPKASVEWRPFAQWSARLSFGKAFRFPTVGELYQAITTGAVITVPDPSLRPERALSEELAIEHRTGNGFARVSLFNEVIDDALISQSAPLVPGSATLFNYVQNVPRTRARGVEATFDQRNIIPRVDLGGSLTYTDSETRVNPVFPASIGKLLPSVPRWKASAVMTWRPSDSISLTAAARYASRNYGSLDNSDVIGNTYQGFYQYFVVDLRAQIRVNEHMDLSLGVDNVNDASYFLFHPFPQRSFTAQVRVRM